MRFTSVSLCFVALLSSLVLAIDLIESKALVQCSDYLGVSATHFDAVFTPHNKSIALTFDGVLDLSGNVTAEVILTVYGYTALRQKLNPCDLHLEGLCPANPGPIHAMSSNIKIPQDVIDKVPGVAYTIPDLDASVRVYINSSDVNKVTCVEATLSNGKTAYQPAVSWAMAVITGIGLVASAITLKAAPHVMFYIISLFGFMQSQALIGMTSVPLPPIVDSWTQNFQWSMGIIRAGFIESFCTWYQRATGGTPSTVFADSSTTSVHVLKRRYYGSLLYGPVSGGLFRRDDAATPKPDIVVRGIERVAFRAGIEMTNIFLTGLVFFVVFVAIVVLAALLKTAYKFFIRSKGTKHHPFKNLRDGWRPTAKTIMFRVTLIGYPQVCTLCLWEITQRDSIAEVLLAIVMLLTMTITLGSGLYKVIRPPTRGDLTFGLSSSSNEWEILSAQYKPAAHCFAAIGIAYIFLRCAFIGLSQAAPVVQTLALLILQTATLIAVCIYRPWPDRRANILNISITVLSSLNAILLLFFVDILNQPSLVTGIMGVAFFVYNALSTFILLLTVLIAAAVALFSKPTDPYVPLPDPNTSPPHSHSTTELNPLSPHGAVQSPLYKTSKVKHREFPSPKRNRTSMGHGPSGQFLAPYALHARSSLVDLSVPLLPSDALSREASPSRYADSGGRSRSVSPFR